MDLSDSDDVEQDNQLEENVNAFDDARNVQTTQSGQL